MDIDAFFQNYEKMFAQGPQEAVEAFLRDGITAAESEKDAQALVVILNEAAGYFRSTSRYAEAIIAADRAVSTLRELGYEGTVPYGTTLLNAATAYREAGDGVNALELFISSLTVLSGLLPEDDHRLAGLYNNISALYREKGNWQDALEMLRKAAAIMERHTDMAADTATVLANLGLTLFRLHREDEALTTLEKAEAMFRQTAGEGTQKPAPHYAAALAGLGEAHFRTGDFSKAAQFYESALTHLRQAFGENRDYAVTCRNCADAYEAAGDRGKARLWSEKAQAVFTTLDADD